MRLFLLLVSITLFMTSWARQENAPEKVLTVKVNDFGLITVAGDTVSAEHVARYVQERLFKSYMGTGHMYDRIQLEKLYGGASGEVMEMLIKEIKGGQLKALQQLCLQKFNKTYDMLDSKKQARLKKQFPVLFQDIHNQQV
jgi:hypothetical protein